MILLLAAEGRRRESFAQYFAPHHLCGTVKSTVESPESRSPAAACSMQHPALCPAAFLARERSSALFLALEIMISHSLAADDEK